MARHNIHRDRVGLSGYGIEREGACAAAGIRIGVVVGGDQAQAGSAVPE